MLTAHTRPTQKQKILNLLKQRGKNGAYNWEFATELHVLKYTNRLSELYQDGHNIRRIPEGNGSNRYILVEEKEHGDER